MVECFVNLSTRLERDISEIIEEIKEDETELFWHMLLNSPATILGHSLSLSFLYLKVGFFLNHLLCNPIFRNPSVI